MTTTHTDAIAAIRQALEAGPMPISTELCGDRHFQGPYSYAELTCDQDAFITAANPSALRALLARVAEQDTEIHEQCRLNGMGSEREARLRARVAELEVCSERMSVAGSLIANTMFNLAQQTNKFGEYHCKLFKSMQVKCDAALAPAIDSAEGQP